MGVVLNLDGKQKREGSVQPLVDLTKADMGRVNEMILSRAGSDVEMIPEVANHLISSGGKRLRPMMTLAAARMFGYEGDGHVRLATWSNSCIPLLFCMTMWSMKAICVAVKARRA